MLLCSLASLAAIPAIPATLSPRATMLPAQDPVVVTITGVGADPRVVTTTSGTPLEWRNRDDRAHTITADDGSFGPIQLNDGDTSSPVSPPPGLHGYHIDSVSNVTGTLVVRDGTAAPTATSTAGSTVNPGATMTAGLPSDSATIGAATPTGTPTVTDAARPTNTPAATATGNSTDAPAATATDTVPTTGACTAATPMNTAPPPPPATDTPPATLAPVTITHGMLDPDVVTVTAGMIVQWTNLQTFPVTVTQSGGFVLGPINPHASASHQFVQPGNYQYYVQGTNTAGLVIVRQAAVPGATATDILATATATGTGVGATSNPASCTATPAALSTAIGAPTSTATPIGAPTATSIPSATPATTVPPTDTTGPTATSTIVSAGTPTATSASTPTSTGTPTATSAATPTWTPTIAATATTNPTATWIATPPTASATPSSPMDTATPSAGAAFVTITRDGFDPQIITVTAGTDVRWTNFLTYPVTVSGQTTSFGFVVGPIDPQHAADHRFTLQGRYQYYLQGTQLFGLVVVQPDVGAPTATSSSTPPATPAISPTQGVIPSSTATTTATTTATATATLTATPTSAPVATPSPTSPPLPSPTRMPAGATTPAGTGTSVPAATPTVAATPAATSSPMPSATATGATPPTALPAATGSPPPAPSATAAVEPPATMPSDAPPAPPATSTVPVPPATSPTAPPPALATPTNSARTASQPATIAPATSATSATSAIAVVSLTATPLPRGASDAAPHPTPTAQKDSHQPPAQRRPTSPARPPARPPARQQQHAKATMELSANGQVWYGRARVDLTLSAGLYGGQARGRLRVHDASARRTFDSQRIDRLRPTRHGMVVTGLMWVGHRTVSFMLDVETVGHTTTVTLTIAPLRYRRAGRFHGRLLLHAPSVAPATRDKPNRVRRRIDHAQTRKGRGGR